MTTATGRPLRWWRAKEKENYSCFLMWELLLSISGVSSSLLLERSSGLSMNVKKEKISCDDVRLLFTSMCAEKKNVKSVRNFKWKTIIYTVHIGENKCFAAKKNHLTFVLKTEGKPLRG